jgi:hypothetical protein
MFELMHVRATLKRRIAKARKNKSGNITGLLEALEIVENKIKEKEKIIKQMPFPANNGW